MIATKEIIEFKSNRDYFYAEKDDLKNNTIRQIDMTDERFQKLIKAFASKDYPLIRINYSELPLSEADKAVEVTTDRSYSFIRRIQHIAIYKDHMIITWQPRKEELE